MSGYFKHFPIIEYNGVPAIDIVSRATLSMETKKNRSNYYPYTIKEGERPETIAQLYYKNSDMHWAVCFSNEILDPYYDFYNSQEDFDKLIKIKYGSVTEAKKLTHFYRNDWISDQTELTPAGYEALAPNLKKYWIPILSSGNNIIAYERKNEDWVTQTNKVISLNISLSTNTEFSVGEIVIQKDGSTEVGRGEILHANTSYLQINHVQGSFSNNASLPSETLTGDTSTATSTTTSVVTLKNAIDPAEEVYWSRVSKYEYETELNEKQKTINLIDATQKQDLRNGLKDILK